MLVIPTDTPRAQLDGDKVIATVVSEGTRFSVQMTPHEAMMWGHSLCRAATDRIASQPEAEIIAFART